MKRSHILGVGTALVAALLLTLLAADARPNRYGHGDREERHLFPAVSTGPLDPSWSPDGEWIAFSMRGDIWKVPAEGGEAVALTSGPHSHFEPAWSPDGRRIALSLDVDGNLEIGLVSAEGGPVAVIASHPRVDLQPTWSPDGNSLYFVSARGRRSGGAVNRIYRYDLHGGADTAVSVARGVQPSASPGGTRLAYVSGGLRVLDLETGESELVRAEETAFRMRPRWTPDGRSLLYVSDERGSNDVRIIRAGGGRPVELTIDDSNHELSPAPSPDGSRFAFVSNHAGPTTLYVLDIAGGRPGAWHEVRITSRRPVAPEGRVRVRVLGPDGRPMPARVYVDASDGRSYSPEGGFHRAMMVFDRHYFHTRGEDEVVVPAGATRIEALRGFEYRPAGVTVDVPEGGEATATIRLERLVDMAALGWYSGDTHLHDLHQGRYGQTHESFFLQILAEDLRMAHSLIHMDGTRIQGRWEDLTGEPHPLSTSTHVLQYGQEFRGGLGHIGMIGTREFILPFTSGAGGTPYAQHSLDLPYFQGAHEQGGIAGYMHPYASRPRTPERAAGTQAALNVALGYGDFYDVGALWSDELASADLYHRLLNAGFRIAATGGTDNFADVWRDPPSGSDRTYVRLDGPFSPEAWMRGVAEGRTFVTTGPMLWLEVEGRGPGDEIALAAGDPPTLGVRAESSSITPIDSLQILVNGEIVRTVRARDSLHVLLETTVDVPRGGWVAARVLGPPTPYIGDDYAFAETSPVYVVRGGRRFVSAEDVRFLRETVDAIWSRVEDSSWRTEEAREEFHAAVEAAREVYRQLAEEAAVPLEDAGALAPGTRSTDTIPGTEVAFEMAYVPGGTFRFGSPDDELGRDPDEGPRRPVALEPFWMGVHEVTYDAYARFRHRRLDDDVAAGELPFDADAVTRPSTPYDDPAHGMGREGHPAVGMTREAALRFARWLSLKTGRLYRLPTEAEWERACRAGTEGPFSFGDDPAAAAAHAWYEDNSAGAYHPVGTREPNPWGLHDMHGNVAEWTSDPYDEEFHAGLRETVPTPDPRAGEAGRGRGVVRGGAFDDAPTALRCADRQPESTAWKRRDPQVPKSRWWNTDSPHVGFRLVRPVDGYTMDEIRAYWNRILDPD